eukprot:4457642-Prymnesium_polylepis.1
MDRFERDGAMAATRTARAVARGSVVRAPSHAPPPHPPDPPPCKTHKRKRRPSEPARQQHAVAPLPVIVRDQPIEITKTLRELVVEHADGIAAMARLLTDAYTPRA